MAMRSVRTALTAAVAALIFAGASARAESGNMHTLTVQLPNGGIAKIR